jgi:CheY-like chemotaxis protein
VGNYDAAREVLGEVWESIGAAPKIENLSRQAAAEVLLRVGTLTGWIGSTKQIEGSQEIAKNLITQSITIFESLSGAKKVAEAQIEIALCYEREGALDDARVMFTEALNRLDDQDGDLKAVALLRTAVLEKLANRLNEALEFLRTGTPLFLRSENHTLRGRFHNEHANLLRRLGEIENRGDYIDNALIEYVAASFHFEQAGHDRYQACVENNLAILLFHTKRLEEAYQHLDRAETLFTTLADVVHQAQVTETRARVMLSEGALVQAERNARRAVQLLETGDESGLLAEALTTQGIALARLRHKEQAHLVLDRAIHVAEHAGDLESAGLAALALAEELPDRLSDDELFSMLECADNRLKNTQNAALLRRQKDCFRHFAVRILWPDWPIAFEESVHRHEARHILRALEDAGGVIRQAARLLSLSYQGLQKILNTRHKNLRTKIAEIKDRRRKISSNQNPMGASIAEHDSEVGLVRILHVEDNDMVAGMAKEMFETQGWQVDSCTDGNEGLERISGNTHYDLFLFDYDLPGVNGLELVRRARNLAHRDRIPIVVLSATPVGAAAREAGADVFLQKPQDVTLLVETISRLLGEREQDL